MRRNESSLKKQREALGFFQGPESYNRKELSSANQLREPESGFFPQRLQRGIEPWNSDLWSCEIINRCCFMLLRLSEFATQHETNSCKHRESAKGSGLGLPHYLCILCQVVEPLFLL